METFGRYLSRQRELRGMTTAQVVEVTKLSPMAVEALEGDRFDELPARVFVLGYLRAYAECIGLNPDEVVLRYDEYLQQQGRPPDVTEVGPSSRRKLRILLAVVAVGLAVAATAVVFLR